MAKVFNWHLNRTMEYPFSEVRPKKQFAMVFDTNKCIACQTCTIACKNAWTSGQGQEHMWWNNVESKPWGFYPLGWDVRLLDKLGPQPWNGGTYAGKTVFEAAPAGEIALGVMPEKEDWSYPNIGEDEVSAGVKRGDYIRIPHQPWMFYLQRICNHCTYPACASACPRKSIYKRPEDGIVLNDQTRCRGYQECIRACPYKKVMFREDTGKTEKCIGCYPRVENGFQTECVVNCIGKIRLMGFLSRPDQAREDNPLDYLVHVRKVALPLYPQFGTEPNIYYVPPLNVPARFSRMMFGPGVERAMKEYRKAAEDDDLAGLLVLFGSTPRIIHHFQVKDGRARGWDEKNELLVEVPIKEPIKIRPFHDEQRNVYRFNIL